MKKKTIIGYIYSSWYKAFTWWGDKKYVLASPPNVIYKNKNKYAKEKVRITVEKIKEEK